MSADPLIQESCSSAKASCIGGVPPAPPDELTTCSPNYFMFFFFDLGAMLVERRETINPASHSLSTDPARG
jgi:hypothetical protein